MEPPPPWPSLTPAPSRRAALALAAVAALPGLALLTYGWGPFFGVGWAIVGLLTARAVERLDDPGRARGLVAGWVPFAGVMLGFTYSWFAPSLSTDVYATNVWAIGGGACGAPLVVAWLAVSRRPEVFAARRCSDRVWARVAGYDGARTVILDFRTGERFSIADRAHGLDCVAPPGVRRQLN